METFSLCYEFGLTMAETARSVVTSGGWWWAIGVDEEAIVPSLQLSVDPLEGPIRTPYTRVRQCHEETTSSDRFMPLVPPKSCFAGGIPGTRLQPGVILNVGRNL
jgi:hypothetical protein